MAKKIEKWIDLSELPRKHGFGTNQEKLIIDWRNSVGCEVKFYYEGIEGKVKIEQYEKNYLKVSYNNKEMTIHSGGFVNCQLGEILKNDLNTYIYDKTNPRRVDLRNIPYSFRGFDWNYAVDNKIKIPFYYLDIGGEIEIINYDVKKQYIDIKYLNKEPFEISIGSFIKACLGKYLKKYTYEFKVEIGVNFKDDKRDIIILEREYRNRVDNNGSNKWYKYKCLKCGYEGWVIESKLMKDTGCSCCCIPPQVVVENINSIVAKPETQWMISYFQGGYEEAKLYTPNSSKKIHFICPDCGRVRDKEISISNLCKTKSIGCSCGDGISYPEKFMFRLLEKLLEYKFKYQITKKDFEWCENYRYDFYFELNNEKYIVETDGFFHKKDNTMSGQTKEQSKSIDDEKDNLAHKNGIKVIRIDCEESDMEFIKDKILHSNLNDLFDLDNINWLECEEFALSNLVKEVCEIKKDNPNLFATDISKIINLSSTTVRNYLKKGSKIWSWIDYSVDDEKKRLVEINSERNTNRLSKPIEVFKEGVSLGVYKSCSLLEKNSEKDLGVKLYVGLISKVCNGERTHHKGFTFKYTN